MLTEQHETKKHRSKTDTQFNFIYNKYERYFTEYEIYKPLSFFLIVLKFINTLPSYMH